MSYESDEVGTFGIVAEFDDPDVLIEAAEHCRDAGYKKMDAHTPFPVHGLSDAIGFQENYVPWMVFIGGLTGMAAGLGLMYFVSVVDYPMNVGGRPDFSWPSFIPVTFECTILFSAFAAFFGMLGLNGLPKPYHSVFNTPNFERASNDRFFLAIEATDPNYDPNVTKRLLEGLGALRVSEVEK